MFRSDYFAVLICLATLALVAGCGPSKVTIEDTTKFAEQGPGAASPEELVEAIKRGVAAGDIAVLQQLFYAKSLTEDDRRTLNAQFIALIDSKLEKAEYLDDLAVLKSPAQAEWAWYVYDPNKHDPLIEAAQAAVAKAVVDAEAGKTDVKAPELIPAPTQPDPIGQPTVAPRGALVLQMPSLGKGSLENKLSYLVGSPPGGKTYYLGWLHFAPPPAVEPSASPVLDQ